MAKQQQQIPVTLPEGFQRLGSDPNAGWFVMTEIGNVLSGKLEGMYQMKSDLNESGKQDFFQIRINKSCKVRMGSGEDVEIVDAQPGDSVNINYGPQTRKLEPLLPELAQGAVYEVYGVIAGDKIPLKGKKFMHNFVLGAKRTKSPTATDVVDFGSDEAV